MFFFSPLKEESGGENNENKLQIDLSIFDAIKLGQ